MTRDPDAQCPTCGGGGLVPDPTWDWVRCEMCNPWPKKPKSPVKDTLTAEYAAALAAPPSVRGEKANEQ
jgi:hypothetical protein